MSKDIYTAEDLLSIEKNGEYYLRNDIDFEGKKIPCIAPLFSGKIHGGGFSIKNLILSDIIWGDEQKFALFRVLDNAEITNISFDNIRLEYDEKCYSPRVAVVAGECNNCRFSNIRVEAINESDSKTCMFYEFNECISEDNEIRCNGKITKVAKYD